MRDLTALVMLGALLACRSGGRAASDAMTRLEKTRDTICACKDVTCADQAQHDHERWLQANAARLKKGRDPSQAYQDRLARVTQEAQDCRDQLVAAVPPPPPPPPDAPAEEVPRPAPLEGPPIEEIEPTPPKPPGYKLPTSI